MPIAGRVGFGWWPPGGGLRRRRQLRLRRRVSGRLALAASAGDHTPPAITSSVTGMAGNNGWYVSDVSVTWDVQDADSAVTSQTGCDPATVAADTAGTTFTCEATSEGRDGDVVDRRAEDTTAPTVMCARLAAGRSRSTRSEPG